MENQHQKITGYRDLSQREIDLMNEVKSLAHQVGELVFRMRTHSGEADASQPALDQRWVSVGATDLQQGFMALVRSIAQPTTF